ncbi:hypothetical protein EKN06_01850 [Croceicoccus ponticola]|uniref:Tetratricopeptide repeat protein n=1 Tax=Croceicoccus ponticola TaxID=2217664 RepID=A0A437H057_9SPHN|nr:hypothetical protein [Croceicoccus ponticola]RVQ68984.1 hypothetical protein EKN06_01850 [Croceicoccus ponticola]
MSAFLALAFALAAGSSGTVDTVDVAYDALTQGRTEAAIAKLETRGNSDDPARLINLAAAYTAQGRFAEARATYEQAAFAERYELETADGKWQDSRVLARQAMAGLDRMSVDTRMARNGQ